MAAQPSSVPVIMGVQNVALTTQTNTFYQAVHSIKERVDPLTFANIQLAIKRGKKYILFPLDLVPDVDLKNPFIREGVFLQVEPDSRAKRDMQPSEPEDVIWLYDELERSGKDTAEKDSAYQLLEEVVDFVTEALFDGFEKAELYNIDEKAESTKFHINTLIDDFVQKRKKRFGKGKGRLQID